MRTGPSLLLLGALLVGGSSFAQPTQRPLRQAKDALFDASNRANRAGPACSQPVAAPLQQLASRVGALGPNTSSQVLQAASQEASQIGSTAAWNRCPDAVVDAIHRAVDSLDEARARAWSGPGSPGGGNRGNGRGNGGGRDGDRSDDRYDDDQQGPGLAQLSSLRVTVNGRFENEPAVLVSVPELTLRGMRGQNFYLGARFKSFQGHWSEWVTTQLWSAPQDPFVWRDAFNHYFRYSTLAEEDFSEGRFVAQVSIFDANGRQLAFRDATFRVQRLPQLPVAPPPVVVQPPPVVQRDCGTGADIGCGMMRNGQYPMDGPTWAGLLRALNSNQNEAMRSNTIGAALQRNSVTAVQFGLLLDLFRNESLRMRVAEMGAPRVVNPQHAIGYADKWTNGALGAAYTRLMLAQQQGGGQPMQPLPPPPPPVMQQPGPPAPPQQAYRDCGTGPQDPGCSMQKNGRWPMDGRTWVNIVGALRNEPNIIIRARNLESMMANQVLSADQLGQVLDVFDSELYKLDAAKFLAPRVTNPMQALQFSNKFHNSILGRDYVKVMSAQQ